MQSVIKKKFRLNGLDCSACAITIDGNLEDLAGVKRAKTNYAKSETEVEFDQEKIDEQKIADTIKKSGFSVTDNS